MNAPSYPAFLSGTSRGVVQTHRPGVADACFSRENQIEWRFRKFEESLPQCRHASLRRGFFYPGLLC